MKRIFLFIIALTLTACSTNQPALTPTPVEASPTPVIIPTATIFAETQIEITNAVGGGLSSLAEKNIQAGMYQSQIDGLKNWATHWREGQLISEAKVNATFFEDQNDDPMSVYAAVDIGDALLFPPLVVAPNEIPKPAYENTDWANAPLIVNKRITEAQALTQGYSPDMAKYLDGSDFSVRGRQFTRTKNNQVIAYLGPEGKWVKEETRFQMVPEWKVAFNYGTETPPQVSQEDLNSRSWLHYVMRNDKTGPPDLSKIIWRPISGGISLTYQDPGAEMRKIWNNDVNTRMSRRVSWAVMPSSYKDGSPFDTVRVVKFFRQDGLQVWGQVVSNSNPYFDSLPDDLPNYDQAKTTSGLITPPETKAIYDKWINSGNPPLIPLELDGEIMDRFFY